MISLWIFITRAKSANITYYTIIVSFVIKHFSQNYNLL